MKILSFYCWVLATAWLVHAVSLRLQAQAIAPASAPYGTSISAGGNSYGPKFSGNGRWVAFVSHAQNLVTNDDLAPHLDLFLRDLVSSNTVLVSVSTNGFGGANDSVATYSLSTNGQFVAFETMANNLAEGDANRLADVYVRDTVLGVTRWVSVNAEGTGNANAACINPLISEDGRFVVFESVASNLVTNDFNETNDIFIRNLAAGKTELVSVNAEGTASPHGPSHSPTISANGLRIAFVSTATNIVSGVTNVIGEVYVRDLANGTNLWAPASHLSGTRVRDSASGLRGPYLPSEPVLSGDGRYVAFKTLAWTVRFDLERPTNGVFTIVTNQTAEGAVLGSLSFEDNPRLAGSTDAASLDFSPDGSRLIFGGRTNLVETGLFRVDFDTLTTNVYKITSQPGGAQGGSISYSTNIGPRHELLLTNFNAVTRPVWTEMKFIDSSPTGERIVFLADATNLVDGVTNRSFQLYSFDVPDRTIRLLSTNLIGQPGTELNIVVPSTPSDGSVVTWESPDDNLVAGDANRSWDVFLQNLDSGERSLVSSRESGLPAATALGLARLNPGSLSANGQKLALLSYDSNLAPHDTNRQTDLFVRDLGSRTTRPLTLPRLPGPESSSTPGPAAPVLSADGRRVAFAGQRASSTSTNLTLYWCDTADPTKRIVVSGAATINQSSSFSYPSLSSDGLSVAFHSADRLDPYLSDGTGGYHNIFAFEVPVSGQTFLRNPQLISTSRLSVGAANAASIYPVFSPDGAWVLFQSKASDLTSDFNTVQGSYQLFARHRFLNETNLLANGPRYVYEPIRLVSYNTVASMNPAVSSVQSPLPRGGANPVFSADSRYVAFVSQPDLIYRHALGADVTRITSQIEATFTNYFTNRARLTNDLICTNCASPSLSGDGNTVAYETRYIVGGAVNNVFVKNLLTGEVELVSVAGEGSSVNGHSFTPLLSHDARYVVFASKASNLVAGDNNQSTDIFVRDRFAGVTHCLSRGASGTGTGNRVSSHPVLSADGRTVAFQSFASDLIAGDYNDTRDVFVVTLAGPDNDHDGMDDDWEMAYFSTIARDGLGDFDNDGSIDRDEFRAGTNPANDSSILRVIRLTTALDPKGTGKRNTVLLWSAIPGKTYRVEFKPDVEAPWAAVGGDVFAGSMNATTSHLIQPGEAGANQHGFYRVLLVQ